MSSEATTQKAFYQQPIVIIFALFIAGFFLVQHFSQQLLSDAPLTLTKGDPNIVIYSTENCSYCYITKAFFEKHNLPYTEYDIDRSEKHMNMFYLLGGRGTPLTIINKEIIHGFNEGLMREAL